MDKFEVNIKSNTEKYTKGINKTMTECFPNIGKRMKALRVEQNMTQKDLSEKTGIDKRTISAYETGSRIPTALAAMSIASVLTVPLEYLCGITDNRYNIMIPKDINLDLTKLNQLGIKALCDYYKALCIQPEYVK